MAVCLTARVPAFAQHVTCVVRARVPCGVGVGARGVINIIDAPDSAAQLHSKAACSARAALKLLNRRRVGEEVKIITIGHSSPEYEIQLLTVLVAPPPVSAAAAPPVSAAVASRPAPWLSSMQRCVDRRKRGTRSVHPTISNPRTSQHTHARSALTPGGSTA